MSKAVLVMDMPESCAECSMYIEEDDMFGICGYCSVENKELPVGYKENRAYWCPLKPLPEKQALTFAKHGEDMITMGWNACIEAMGGE